MYGKFHREIREGNVTAPANWLREADILQRHISGIWIKMCVQAHFARQQTFTSEVSLYYEIRVGFRNIMYIEPAHCVIHPLHVP